MVAGVKQQTKKQRKSHRKSSQEKNAAILNYVVYDQH